MQQKSCSKCGREFGCGRKDPSCWCADFALLPGTALDPRFDCMCPDCLRQHAGNRTSVSDGKRGDPDGAETGPDTPA